MTILITGGAGYIGSHMAWLLVDSGETVCVLDNLSTGSRAAVPGNAVFEDGDAGDVDRVRWIIRRRGVDAVMHFAGSIIVPESVRDPLGYYRNNTAVSRSLLEACVSEGVGKFIFSSTAAVYGDPGTPVVDESAPLQPLSPYGTSKLMTELMLRDAAAAHQLKYIALRYFNVAGADPLGRTGQNSPNATHLIKVACEAAVGLRNQADIYGVDYPTPDGTGIRDYIHVSDLVEAHRLALNHLRVGGDSRTLNCGYGYGYSVREVIEAVRTVSGGTFRVREVARRDGDCAQIVADNRRIVEELNWQPRYADLSQIVTHALAWEQRKVLIARARHELSVRKPQVVLQ